MLPRALPLGVSILTVITLVSAVFAAETTPLSSRFLYGGDAGQRRYSPLKQIDRNNVQNLEVAWTYDTRVEGRGAIQTQPTVIDGTLFGITPEHKVIALDAATGELRWEFDPGTPGRGANRGFAYWESGDEKRLFFSTRGLIFALDPKTGRPFADFGSAGSIDLRQDLGRDPEKQSVVLTSPGIIFQDTLIVGGRTSENLPASPGDIRAYDVRTGKLKWSFHTLPHPGEPGHETWPADAWMRSGSANNWTGMAVDEQRGIVYVPTGSAAADFYGADRVGDNLYANTLLALDARTGKLIWHFQAVKHDIWDRDLPAPPTLLTVQRDGKAVDAVAQVTKSGHVYLFNREDGTPLFPIEYREFPASDVPGEVASRTQPVPLKPAPFARQLLTEDMLTQRTPAVHQAALEQFRALRSEGQFIPFSVDRQTVVFPGFDGGPEWGGAAADPETGVFYVNSNDLAWTASLAKADTATNARQLYVNNCAACHRDDKSGFPPAIPSLNQLRRTEEELIAIVRTGTGRMPGFPSLPNDTIQAISRYVLTGEDAAVAPGSAPNTGAYRFTGYRRWMDADGYPAVQPPWGTLNAIDLNTGEYLWKIPLGEHPELAAQGIPTTGSENYGGPVVTAGGLVFIAATSFDNKLRAFDKATGKLLWETVLPFAGNATPAVYEVNGRQYVAIFATGGRGRAGSPTGGVYMAFALPAASAK